MELKDLLKEVRQLELSARRRVTSSFVGHYTSAFRGSGMQFSDTRPYIPGDDVRHIAWNISARSQSTQIKRFEEERELNVVIAMDVSGSRYFGGNRATVGRRLVHVGATIALAALQTNDRVGALLFTDIVEKSVPMKKTRAHILRLIREMLVFEPRHTRTDLNAVFKHLENRLRRHSLVFIISDFIAPPMNESTLRMCARKHEVIAIRLRDPFEDYLPSVGLLQIQDTETGAVRTLDVGLPGSLNALRQAIQQQRKDIAAQFKRSAIELLDLDTPERDIQRLTSFFIERKGRQGFARPSRVG